MTKHILNVVFVVVLWGKSYIWLVIIVNLKRIPTADNNPNSDIEFPIQDNKGILDVLLSNPGLIVSFSFLCAWIVNLDLAAGSRYKRQLSILTNLLIAIEYLDFSTATQATWFYDP